MTSVLIGVWGNFTQFLNENASAVHSLSELVKFLGSLASFYAVYRLSKIEKKYLFKATIPVISKDIEKSLSQLNKGAADIDAFGASINEALNCLYADAKSLRRKVNGDSKVSVDALLASIRRTGLGRRFWERFDKISNEKDVLLDIYGKGHGLLRSLKNDVGDMRWAAK